MVMIIQTDADFTPRGKRRVRMVQTSRGGTQLRWYVAGRIYRRMNVTHENVKLSKRWTDEGNNAAT